MIHKALLAAGVTILVSFSLGACGGDDGPSVVETTRQPGTPQNVPTPTTGIPELDQVINAALARDYIELAGLTGYQRVACASDSAEGPGAPPVCRSGEEDGTEVEVLPVSACEGTWVRPEQVPDAFRGSLSEGELRVAAVFRPNLSSDAFGGGFGAEYGIALGTGPAGDGTTNGAVFQVKDGRVVWIQQACAPPTGGNLEQLIEPGRVQEFIVAPAGAQPTAGVTP